MMKNKIEFKKKREFGDIIGDTFVFIKENFKPLFKAFFILCGLFMLANLAATIMQQINLVDGQSNMIRSTSILKQNFGYYMISAVFLCLNYTAMYVTVLSFIALYIQKGNIAPSVDEVWSFFKFYYFRVFGSLIGVSIFCIICFAACFFPGVYVFPAISLFFPIMIFENGGFGYSFSRSFKLINNEWWITFGTFLIIWIITYAFLTIVQLPTIIITMVKLFAHSGQGLSRGHAIIMGICQQLSHIFLVIPIISAALIYFNLIELKENTGLMDRINAFGNTDEAKDQTHLEEY